MSPRVLLRRLLGTAMTEGSVTVQAGPSRARTSTLGGLSHQVTTYAAEGASSSEIARRTGLAHDAIALILHFGEGSATGRGTIRRNDSGSWGWVADA